MFLAGFSQGGAIALAAGLRRTRAAGRPDRAVDLPADGASAPRADRRAARIAQPVFMAHGTQDPVVPYAGRRAQRATLLRELGFAVDWHALSDAALGLRGGDRATSATG